MSTKSAKKRLGIVGGLGALAGADVYFKLVRTMAKSGIADRYDVLFEQHPFEGAATPVDDKADLSGRKLYIYDMMKRFEDRKVDSVLVPCFLSHTFLPELASASTLPLVDIIDAVLAHLHDAFPPPRTIGILTSDYVRKRGLFERRFADAGYTLAYPSAATQDSRVMQAIYGKRGIQSGNIEGSAVELLHEACMELLEHGADVIVPGTTEIAIVADSLRTLGVPIIDTNQAYADFALEHDRRERPRPFKVGIIGGVGPAATVDFMRKIVNNTEARRDQDHIRMVVEHNPGIPDRTANLIGDGEDPTIALYAACKRLEENDANLIAIPCNTAHAYVARIQPHLSVPIVNMLHETVSHIVRRHPECRKVGVLATSGTVASKVYHDAIAAGSLETIVPDEHHQALVMDAIYGEQGVKAGHIEGACKRQLRTAMEHLAARGADVLILGCTELPLLQAEDPALPLAGRHVAVLDPTAILARRCVQLSRHADHAADGAADA
ncbi:MAG TPA: amino acid racemase [Noviherbaspirillum sp.]